MNGSGVISTPPKPAPKPLAKPPLPRQSTSDAIPVQTEKPLTSPKPSGPPIAQKPRPGKPPVVSPKPPVDRSSRPRSESLPALVSSPDPADPGCSPVPVSPAEPDPSLGPDPSPSPISTPGTVTSPVSASSPCSVPPPSLVPVSNGGSQPPPVASKPKPKCKPKPPPVKRKSWINSTGGSLDLNDTSTSEAITEKKNTTASNKSVCHAKEILPEVLENNEEHKSVGSESIDHSLFGKDSKDNSDVSQNNQSIQSTDNVLSNPDTDDLNREPENHTSPEIDSNGETAVSPFEKVEDSSNVQLTNIGITQSESSATVANSEVHKPPEDIPCETLPSEGITTPDLTAIPKTISDLTAAPDRPVDPSALTSSAEVATSPTSTKDQEGDSGVLDSEFIDDEDDAFEEDSATKDKFVDFVKPPVPAPRTSLSSTTSEVSSLDSYDLISRSRGGSSFKSAKSSNSIRSQGSSRLGSDSEDESGVFEVQQDIPEEDEENLDDIQDIPGEDSLKAQNSRISVFQDLQEKEGNIADGDQDIVLVSVTADIQRNSEVKENSEARDKDQILSESGCGSIEGSADEISRSNSDALHEGHVRDQLADERDADAPEDFCKSPSKVDKKFDEYVIGDSTSAKAGESEVQKTYDSSELQGSEAATETKGKDSAEREEGRIEVQKELPNLHTEESEEEEEEEFDEMGKRIFSLSRKKKHGVLKYSSGEFHEQYESSGKEKAVPEVLKSKDTKKKSKKDLPKGKKDALEQRVVEDVFEEAAAPVAYEEQGASSEEDRPSKPPRMRPGATPEELEIGRASTTSDVSTNPVGDEDVKQPMPAPRLSKSLPSPRPKISLTHRGVSLEFQSDDDNDDDEASPNLDTEVASPAECVGGGAGPIVTQVGSDGEEEVFIGGVPSSTMCTQTAFADQASVTSSADESTEVSATPQRNSNPQQFRHYATIEPVGTALQQKESPSAEAVADSSTLMFTPTDTLTTLSENQSVTISVTESEPLSDSTEFLSHPSEHAINKPWSDVAAVTVAMTSMPEPLVPEFTHVEGESSTTSSSSSLLPCQPNSQENNSLSSQDSVDDDDDDDDDDDNDDTRNMYDRIDIYDDSYKKKDWKYRETEEELNTVTQPDPENAEEEAEAKDTISHLSESSLTTTASEKEFRSIFERPHRIKRRRGSEDFVRLSRISRERTIALRRQDGTYGMRIQKSKPVVVTSVVPGGPAESAGLKVGDMVLKVNGHDVRQVRHSEVVKLATEAPEPLMIVVGTVVCNSLNLSGDHPIMSGYMHKLATTGMIKQWRKRWFVLKPDNCLYFYKSEDDIIPQGAIVLQNYTVTKARDAGKQFSFKLTKEGARTYVFYTANEEERSSWGKAINEAANPNDKSDVWLDISTHNVSLPALSIKDPECTGFLTKWNVKMKNPRRRYCVLKDACLYYYKEMNALEAQGVVHLHGYCIQEKELKGKKFAFTLKPPDEELREFYFYADHDTDRKRWVAALASSIGRWIQTNNPDDGDDDGTVMFI